MLEVRLFGEFSIEIGGEQIKIPSRPAELMFIYLLLHPGTPVRREKLAGILWPETTDDRARSNLRHALWRLRKAFDESSQSGYDYIRSDDETILFDPPADAWIDVALLEREVDASRSIENLIETVGVYQDELLPGFYEDWIVRERDRLGAVYEAKVGLLLERLIGAGRWADVLEWGERWIAMGGAPEGAYRALMIAHSHLDDLSGVASVYRRCVMSLRQELGIEPSEQTRDLYERILEGEKPIPSPVPDVWKTEEEAPPAPGLPPYKGLQYFDQADADLFFGREALTARLVAHLASARFLAVVGASGSGKSSLVRAGLVPALRLGQPLGDGTRPPSGSQVWPIYVIEPSAHPLEALAIGLTRDTETITVTANLVNGLAKDPRCLHLYVSRKLDQRPLDGDDESNQRHLLLVVDQFEELFTLCRSETERAAFLNNLMAAVETDGPTIMVIALRADFYAHCGGYPSLRQALERHQVYIGPMSEAELHRAVTEPALRGGWSFEPGLVEFLLGEVGDEPGALPLLSHVLLETWKRRRGRCLTYVGYNETGGLQGAIARTADRVLEGFDPQEQSIAHNIFLRLTELGEGTQDTRRRVVLDELVGSSEDEGVVNAVLQKLADARLITISEDTVEVAHEVLIREWPTLRRWLNENREALQIHRHLTESAQAWERMERDAGELYRGARLSHAEEWAQLHEDEMNLLERAFLDASLALARQREAEREALRQRELEAAHALAAEEKRRAVEEQLRADEQARASRRFRSLAAWLGVLLAIALGLALVTLRQTNLAIGQARIAKARELAAAALGNLDVDPERSILLALQGVNETLIEDGYVLKEAEEALHRAVGASRLRLTINIEDMGSFPFVNFSTDGERLVAWELNEWGKIRSHGWSAYTRILDAKTGELLLTLPGWRGATFWPGEDRLPTLVFTGGNQPDFGYVIRDSSGGEVLSSTPIPFGWPKRVNCDPDLTRIVYLLRDGTIHIHDLASGDEIVSMGEADRPPDHAAVFSPEGRYLATGSTVGPVNIWDAGSGENLSTLYGHKGFVYDMAYSADGEILATAGEDGTAIAWDANSGEDLVVFSGHIDEVLGLALSTDGNYLATAGRDRKVIVWDLPASIQKGTGQVLFTLAGHMDAVQSVNISPNGDALATASPDGTIRVWDITPSGGGEGHVFVSADPLSSGDRVSITLDEEGARLAVAASDSTPTIWDTARGQLLHTLTGHEVKVLTLAFSPDGAYLVTRSFAPEPIYVPSGSQAMAFNPSNKIKIWDAATGDELISIPDAGHEVSELAFSPDGGLLAVGNSYREVSILDFPRLLRDGWEGAELVKAKIPTQLKPLMPLGVDFSPDGKTIVTSIVGNGAGIWDAETGEALHKLSGHESDVYSVAYSPEGERVATASADGTARIWDAQTGESLRTFIGHTGGVMSVVFSMDGSRLATASMDGSAKVWDAETGEELLTLYGHSGGVTDVAFSPDGRQLYTAGLDGTVRVHLLDIDELVALANSRVTRPLTTQECQHYLHTESCPLTPQEEIP